MSHSLSRVRRESSAGQKKRRAGSQIEHRRVADPSAAPEAERINGENTPTSAMFIVLSGVSSRSSCRSPFFHDLVVGQRGPQKTLAFALLKKPIRWQAVQKQWWSMEDIIRRYQSCTNPHIDDINNPEIISCELLKLKEDHAKLMATMQQYKGEDLTTLGMDDLIQLEKQLDLSAEKVRARKVWLSTTTNITVGCQASSGGRSCRRLRSSSSKGEVTGKRSQAKVAVVESEHVENILTKRAKTKMIRNISSSLHGPLPQLRPKIEPTISEEGRKEILACQERRNLSESKLNSLCDEMRPAVQEHGTHIEDGGSTATTGTWMKSYREYMMNEFDYYSAIIKNAYCAPKSSRDDMAGEGKDSEDGA